jgi:hypothetical protein
MIGADWALVPTVVPGREGDHLIQTAVGLQDAAILKGGEDHA